MQEIVSIRFRRIYATLEPYFDSGRLILLDLDGGYLFFTSDVLHKKYGKAGSGQWLDIPDRFFFALNYQEVVKNGENKKSLDIELFDYGYKEEREEFLSRMIGVEGIAALDERKGYTFLYQHPLFGGKEKKAEQEENTKNLLQKLDEFINFKLPALEKVI
ncbi:MAG: hypothetical protein IJ787_06960 [Bacilli bacterium]|nr:hypothetical protein [Bacilli bacterium]